MKRFVDLETLKLSIGSHSAGATEMCVMEAVANVAGEDWTDRPASVPPVIRRLLQGLNDSMNDIDRQDLRPLVSVLAASHAGGELDGQRSWMVMDWHCRAWPSVWLRAAGRVVEAAALQNAAVIRDGESMRLALRPLRDARAAASAARDAARDDFLREGLGRAVAAAGADERNHAVVAARAALKTGIGWAAIRAAQKAVPVTAGWDADDEARWSCAWDAAGYRMAVADEAARVAAVRALYATSVWDAGWDLPVAGNEETRDLASRDARSAGRDAAEAVALRAAWVASGQEDHRRAWPEAAEAATEALEAHTKALQSAVIQLVMELVGPRVLG